MTEIVESDGVSIAKIYAERIRPQRTRVSVLDIPEKEQGAEILHTLLGIELKVGRRRFSCPDLATARYMRVFARLGCREFAVPYDITKISTAADELETAWHRTLLILETDSTGSTEQERRRKRSRLLKSIREAIAEIGPGEKMPEFKLSTGQSNT
jgi:hypothetical protein